MRRKAGALMLSALLTVTPVTASAASLPTGGEIRYGEGAIGVPVDGALTITQTSERMVIDWLNFSIDDGNAVYFDQAHGPDAVALNRVIGGELSEIYGLLKADGQVFLINPQGIVFGESAQVDVGGLVASSLSLSDGDFLAGEYRFGGSSNHAHGEVAAGPVINLGELKATPGEFGGGYIVLLAPEVRNDGTISAYLGTVALGAGGAATLEVQGGGLLRFAVDQETAGAYLANRGEIAVDGGVAWLEARARDALLSTVLNQEGTVRARGAESRDGRIVLFGGDSGVVEVSGTLDVSSPDGTGGHGGSINVTGERVAVLEGALLDATGSAGGGRVRIGGGYQGQEADIANAQGVYVARGARIDASATGQGDGGTVIVWSDELTRVDGEIAARGGAAGGDGGFVETSGGVLSVSGRVDVTAPAGSAGAWLLDPYDITIGDGTGNVGMSRDGNVWSGEARGAFVTVSSLLPALNGGGVVTVRTMIDGSESGHITVSAPMSWSGTGTLVLQAHGNIAINAAITAPDGGLTLSPGGSATATATAAIDVGRFTLTSGTWQQVGPSVPAFRAGDFRLEASAGFVRARGGDGGSDPYQIFDVYGLQGIGSAEMLSKNYILVDDIDASGTKHWNDGAGFRPIGNFDSSFTGTFDGAGHVIRGLFINRGAEDNVGLFGVVDAPGRISNVGLEDVQVTGGARVGGLVGYNWDGSVSNSYSKGEVTGGSYVGGLVGRSGFGTSVSQSYSAGQVTGTDYVGGLIGETGTSAQILKSYSTSHVTGSSHVGGLIGRNNFGYVSGTYSTGPVLGTNYVGGLVGTNENNSTVIESYSTGQVTGGSYVGGLVGWNNGGYASS